MRDLGGREGVSVILEGGNCEVGVESTVAVEESSDASGREGGGKGDLKVLRPGGVTVEQLREVVRKVDGEGKERKVLVYSKDFKDEKMEKAPTTPGMKYKHYTPSIPVYLFAPVSSTAGSSGSSHPSSSSFTTNGNDASKPLPIPSSTAPSPNVSSSPATISPLPTPFEAIVSLLPPTTNTLPRPIGLMLYDNSPLSLLLPPSSPSPNPSSSSSPTSTTPSNPLQPSIKDLTFIHHPLGSLSNPSQAANRLFDGLLRLEREGCGVIFIEEGEEEGVGRAVGERVGKATGGEKGRVMVRV